MPESDMSAAVSGHDWTKTPVGPMETWSPALHHAVDLMLASAQPSFVVVGQHRVTLPNDACAMLLGVSPTILGRSVHEAIPGMFPELDEPLGRALAGRASRLDDNVVGLPGPAAPLRLAVACTPIRDGVEVIGVLCTLQELPSEAQRERSWRSALQESESRFREMADGLPLVVWVHGPEGEQELVNETFCEFFDVTREEMRGGRWQMLMHPDDADAYNREFLACVQERRPFHGEVRVKRGDGQWRWFESWGRPRFGADGEFRGFVGTSADVSQRKQAEMALRQAQAELERSEQRFRTMANSAPAMLWITDEDHQCTFLSRSWYEFTGQTEAEGWGHGWLDAVHPDDRDPTQTTYLKAAENAEPFAIDYRLRTADGDYRWAHGSGRPWLSDDGRLLGYIGSVIDVHDRKIAEDQLRESARRKDEFLAMLGHELRNPLAAIRTATDLAKLVGPEDPTLRRACEVLGRQTTHMARLIDGLLEVSRIARGKIDVVREPLDLRSIVDPVVQDRAHEIKGAGLELRVELDDNPCWVAGDAVRLAQVFDNLVGNAIRFTEPRGVLTITVREDGESIAAIIRDTGVGIRPEALDLIFEPFQQESQDIARGTGGLGLGLALARGLLELHDGTIEARSQGAGTGAEFIVRLPRSSAPAGLSSEKPAERIAGQRVLVVEDNVDAALMLSDLLRVRGHDVTVAGSGPEALSILWDATVDLVLCDIGLPGMSGLELASRVRSDASLKDVCLIAVTGYGQPVDRERSLAAGFDAHLTKPVDMNTFDAVLRDVCRVPASRVEDGRGRTPKPA